MRKNDLILLQNSLFFINNEINNVLNDSINLVLDSYFKKNNEAILKKILLVKTLSEQIDLEISTLLEGDCDLETYNKKINRLFNKRAKALNKLRLITS